MNFIEKLILAMLVVFGLALTSSLDAQTIVWDDRNIAVDDLGVNMEALIEGNLNGTYIDPATGDNVTSTFTGSLEAERNLSAVYFSYKYCMQAIDDAEDTEQGYLAWEARVDAEALRDTNGTYAQEVQNLKDHILSVISDQ